MRTSTPVLTRRRVVARMGLGAMAALVIPDQAGARAPAQGEVPKDGGGNDATSQDTYIGPVYGHTVTWDPQVWAHSSSAEPDMGYSYDFVGLSPLEIFGLAQIQHVETPLADLDEAEEGAFDHYVSGYGMSRDDAEVLDQWVSERAVGVLYYWLGYDPVPYTYVEYAPTDDDGVWSVCYVQVTASNWVTDAVKAMLAGTWIDGDPTLRAASAEEIVDAVESDMR